MITITKAAAAQIHKASADAALEDLILRLAARKGDDGAIEYGMGFDEMGPDDQIVSNNGVELIVGTASRELLNGVTLDYVELNPGEFHFIFLNPNDPNHRPPETDGPAR